MSRELLAKIAITFDGFVVQKVDVYVVMWDGRCGARDEAEGHEKIIKRIERRCRMNPTEQRWVSETLVKDCETAWLDTTWDEYIN